MLFQPGISGTQLIGITFAVISALALTAAFFKDQWLIEQHLTARLGETLSDDACNGAADNQDEDNLSLK